MEKDAIDHKEIKDEIAMLKVQMRALIGDTTALKGLLTEHIIQDKKRTENFHKREQFFIDSVMKMIETADRMERILKESVAA